MDIKINAGILKLHVKSSDLPLEDICGFASRQNPKRGFLFVSKVLGKHYPVKPSLMHKIYDFLSCKVANLVNESPVLFLGFAETATGLGAGVFEQFNQMSNNQSLYIHTTRYLFNKDKLFTFEEEHSHATNHIVYQPDNFDLKIFKTLVLIDDEITTGKTLCNFIEQFTKLEDCKIENIVIVSIKNWMSDEAKHNMLNHFKNLGINFVNILEGQYDFIKDSQYVCEEMPNVIGIAEQKDDIVKGNYGRFGINNFQKFNFDKLLNQIDINKKTIVLGTGEFSYPPYLLAKFLEKNGADVVFQSTTRSPISIGNDIKNKISFLDNYRDKIPNYVYNVHESQYEQVIICYETIQNFDFDLNQKLNGFNLFFKDIEET